MALQSVSTSSKKYFTIASSSAGSGGVVYTVPTGKSFSGHFYMNYPNSSSTDTIKVNGQSIDVGSNTSYGTWYAFPINLTSEDTVSNNGTEYFTLTGFEE